MMAAQLYIVRHGKTSLNGSGTSVDRIRGWKDVPLNQDGIKEAKIAAQELEGRGIQRVVSSDLCRTRKTGAIVARHLGVPETATKGLRPWDLGVLSGQPSKEAAPVIQHYARVTPDEKLPDGESFTDFTTRLHRTLLKLQEMAKRNDETLALITHFRVLKSIEAGLGHGKDTDQLDLDTFSKNDLNPAAILVMTPDGEHWKVRLVSRGVLE